MKSKLVKRWSKIFNFISKQEFKQKKSTKDMEEELLKEMNGQRKNKKGVKERNLTKNLKTFAKR